VERVAATQVFKERTLILEGADAATRLGWTGVPNFILRSKEVSPGAKLVYTMLLYYAREEDECFPGQERLAEDMGATDRSVRKWLNELEQAKYITAKQRGQGRTNIYTIHFKASFWKRKK